MKTLLFIAAVVAVTACGAEPAPETARQKLRAKLTEAFPAALPATSSDAPNVESPILVTPVTPATAALDQPIGADADVVVMKPLTVVERHNLRRLEVEMQLEAGKKQAEKERHFSIWRGGGIIYEGRLGKKARFAFGVVGPLPFFGISW